MKTTSISMLAACLLLAMSLTGCNGDAAGDSENAPAGDTAPPAAAPGGASMEPGADGTATATMADSAGQELGVLTLRESGESIVVTGTLRGLPPGTHAIHLHETGLCEAPFESAGGHWNPMNREHGTENPEGPHLGDMPNIEVGADGTATVQVTTPSGASLQGTNALLDADGAAVVVHGGADDYRTDPAGDAGARIACGSVTEAPAAQ